MDSILNDDYTEEQPIYVDNQPVYSNDTLSNDSSSDYSSSDSSSNDY